MRGHELSPQRQRATVAAVGPRILPLVFVGYVVAYLDRINISYAQLGMATELGITAAAYGLVAGLFFVGYFAFEIPSNLLLRRFGARIWLARIMITWGLITVATAFVHSTGWLLALRFLLGVAEAGFFPGLVLYLTYWFRARDRSIAMGWLVLAQPASFVIGSLTGGLILDHIHWLGLSGWRWLLLLTAVPAVLVGLIILRLLPETPGSVQWLDPDQKRWLTATLDSEQGPPARHGLRAQLTALRDRRVLHLAAIYLAISIGGYGFNYFLPLIVKQINPEYSSTDIGFTAALPYALGGVFILIFARIAARAAEQRIYVVLPVALTALGLLLVMVFKDRPGIALVGLCFAGIGVFAYLPSFLTMTTTGISRTHAAVGIALVNSIGNIGGFVGPYLVGQGANVGVTAGLISPLVSLMIAVALLLLWRSPTVQPGAEIVPGNAEEVQ